MRLELSRHNASQGQHITSEEIIITNGCTEALYLSLKTVTKTGDTVLVESPVYFGILNVLESLELQALEISTDANHGLDVSKLENIIATHKPAAMILSSSYNNPLGTSTSQHAKRKVLDIAENYNIPLIEDDVYGDLSFEQTRPKPYSALNSSAKIFYCGSFSKTLSPGYRIGWVASKHRMQKLLDNKLAITLTGTALTQAAIASYLSSGDYQRHLKRIRPLFKSYLNSMRQAVEKYFPEGCAATQPKGGFVLWVVLPDGINSRELLYKALKEKICFTPGNMFSASGQYNNALRLSAGYQWDEKMEAAIKRLGELI